MIAATSARAIARPRARAAPAMRRAPASDRRAASASASCASSGRVSVPRSRVSSARVVAARASADPRPSAQTTNGSMDDVDGSGSGSFDEELVYPDLEMSYDQKDISNEWPRKPLKGCEMYSKSTSTLWM